MKSLDTKDHVIITRRQTIKKWMVHILRFQISERIL